MKRKARFYPWIISLFAVLVFSNCVSQDNVPGASKQNNEIDYNFICEDTLSITILKDESDYIFNIPVQYIGYYQIETFDFSYGNILIGDYNILLGSENTIISIMLNTSSDIYGKTNGSFNLVYLEEYGSVTISKIKEPIKKSRTDKTMNQYNINIERRLNEDELANLIKEYQKGNTYSNFTVKYEAKIDNEFGEFGIFDGFELKRIE